MKVLLLLLFASAVAANLADLDNDHAHHHGHHDSGHSHHHGSDLSDHGSDHSDHGSDHSDHGSDHSDHGDHGDHRGNGNNTTTAFATEGDSSEGTEVKPPTAEGCLNRLKHWYFNGKSYYFSWDDQKNVYKDDVGNVVGNAVNWLDARNECRRQCMDTLALETEQEYNMILEFMNRRQISYIWTSGRLCDFKGCETSQFQPPNINGWFWAATSKRMGRTDATPRGWNKQPWSQYGSHQVPQPDNVEFHINGLNESCLAILNNFYEDGLKMHDIACYHPKPFICEESPGLIDWATQKFGLDLS